MKKASTLRFVSTLLMTAALWLVLPSLRAANLTLVDAGATWRYRIGTSEASSPINAWRLNTFAEDGTWNTGAFPIGYTTGANDPLGYEARIVTSLPTSTAGNYLSVFLRKTFVVTNRAAFSSLTLGMVVDDGAVAWINGQEVMRFQCCTGGTDPAIPTYNSASPSAAESASSTNIIVNDLSGPLVDGTNVLTIELFNANLTSSDLVLDAILTATIDDVPPVLANVIPATNSVVLNLFQVEVFFSEAVQGVEAPDLLVNGVPASGITYAAANQFAFDFPQPPTGAVTVAFAPGHGIHDTSGNPFAGASWTYTLDPNAVNSSVIITEFMAANSKTLHDEDGDSSDWIELYNPGPALVNLAGYFLTDQTNRLDKWRIPSVTMAANTYLVVFASGKNRTNNPAKLHTNFQLTSDGEYLALVGPLTNVVSEFYPTFPPQSTDVSYGRDRLNPSLLGYFSTPTPGAANAAGGAGFAPEVEFSRDSGTFLLGTPFLLTLSTPVSNAVIYYALGTNLPGTNSIRYTGAISVTNSTLIQARAFQTNLLPGPISTKSYIALNNQTNIVNFRSTLPIMILHNFGLGPVPASKTRQSVVMQTFEPKDGFSSLTNAPDDAEGGTFHVRGSSTAVGSDAGKSGFYLKIQDAFQDKKTIELLGLPNESDWVLYAPNNFEPALIHNPLAFEFARQQGEYASRYRFFELYLKDDVGSPGAISASDYHGVMVLEEKIKRDQNRVDIAKLEPEHTSQPEVTGGYMFSIDRVAPGETQLQVTGTGLNWVEPDYEDMILPARAPQVTYIRDYFNSFAAALNGANWTNPATGYAAYIDVNSWVTRHLHEVITFNVDALRLSGYLYKDRNKKIQYGPAWDYDRTQGSTDGRDFNPRTWRSQVPDLGTDFFNFSPWWNRLFQSPDFWQSWIDRYQEFRETVYNPTNVVRTIDAVVAQVREAEPRDNVRWPRTLRPANPASAGTGGGTYDTEIQWKKNWYSNRLDFIDTNFLARPRLSIPGGQNSNGFIVALSGPPGATIYYTLNGTDPRASGGAIASGSLAYLGPIIVTGNARIVARSLDPAHRNLTGANNPPISSPWSSSIAGTFVVRTPPLVITELMYNPAPPSSQSDTNDADNFEYIELKNIGPDVLDLVGFKFTNGIDFTFTATNAVTSLAPGGYVLIVKNIASFILRYGAQPNIAGQYGGNLDNSGERITLVGPRLEPILDFTYSDGWSALTDGLGFSLVINDPAAPLDTWGEAGQWHASSFENGSPGTVEPAPDFIPVVLINEALTHTDPAPPYDTVELFNPGTNAANISGWFLTDDLNDPKKYVFPPDTIIAAGDFLLLDETIFNTGPAAFSLSSDGGELYLFSGTNGILTGFVHGFDFGAAQNGVTFGRYVNSQGNEDFTAQAVNTLGSANALPLVGPVVISEIMYHPPDLLSDTNLVDNSGDEFIELRNLALTNVALFDPLHASNTWRLSKAVSFDFPTNVSLAPTSIVLVVNFNPAASPTQATAFRARYDVDPSIPLFGPYGGKLANSSGNIHLDRPDNTNLDGSVPHILVDRVEYRDSGAWPASADGAGPSLHRLVLADYGNDPTNWTAAMASPGRDFTGGIVPAITQQPAPATVFVAGSVATSPLYMVGTTGFVAMASGPGLRYQWQFNNAALLDATNATLVLTNIQFSQAGSYSVVAYNAAGSITSSNAQLTVYSPVTIVVQPVSQNVPAGATVNLGVEAIGVGSLRYQWLFEGTDIPGATNLIYSYSNANVTLNGNYACRVTDDFSSVVSSNAFIYAPPVYFTLQPDSQNVLPGTNVTINSLALGFGPVRYQWQYEGADIPDATNASYSFNNASLDTHGNYRVVATDSLGTVISSNAFIFVLLRPGITAQPLSQSVVQGGTAVFSITATGAPPLYFRWLRNGVLWVSNSFPELIIPNCQSNGSFRCQVVNVAGNANSSSVALTVLADFDGDGIPDAWEKLYGFNTNNAADGLLDSDGDGMNNHDEYVAGTDPLDANSVLKIMLSATSPGMLQFIAQASNSYAVQWRTNLSLDAWQKLSNLPPQSQVRTVEWNAVHPPSDGDRFYRVITPLEP